MTLLIATTPRSGATAYSDLIARSKGATFINEPWNRSHQSTIQFHMGEDYVAPPRPEKMLGKNMVIHSQIGDCLYRIRYFDELVFFGRRNREAQIRSIIISSSIGIWHNMEVKKDVTLRASSRLLELALSTLVIWDKVVDANPDINVCWYEDIYDTLLSKVSNYRPSDASKVQIKDWKAITKIASDILGSRFNVQTPR